MREVNSYENEMRGIIQETLQKYGDLEIKVSSTLADNVMKNLTAMFGGEAVYFKKNTRKTVSDKKEKIKQEFNGSNQVELARRYNLTLVRIYKILKEK